MPKIPQKLRPRGIGPFEITKKVTPLVYELDLPDEYKIENGFHVSLLERFHLPEDKSQILMRAVSSKSQSFLRLESMKDCSISWMVRLYLSARPSVCGWKAVDMGSLVPRYSISDCQKWLLKRLSLSEIIILGIPCSRKKLSKSYIRRYEVKHHSCCQIWRTCKKYYCVHIIRLIFYRWLSILVLFFVLLAKGGEPWMTLESFSLFIFVLNPSFGHEWHSILVPRYFVSVCYFFF